MADKSADISLRLPSLSIKAFRGIKELAIPRLGRVTLLAGKNGVGKTTVLDAVRVYAYRGNYGVLSEILRGRDEISDILDEDGEERVTLNWEALFYGRDVSISPTIAIGPVEGTDGIGIRTVSLDDQEDADITGLKERFPELAEIDEARVLKTSYRGKEKLIRGLISRTRMSGPFWTERMPLRNPLSRRRENERPEIVCESLGPNRLDNYGMARFWDNVTLTSAEESAVKSLAYILGDKVDRVAVVGAERRLYGSRRAMVKIKGSEHRVPLRSLGDGVARVFGVAIALANSRNGFLLIDEVENGIHHSAEYDFWRMVLETARRNNVQVLATTHGWDCVAGFARAALESPDADGALVRLENKESHTRPVEYTTEGLATAAKHGIEVR